MSNCYQMSTSVFTFNKKQHYVLFPVFIQLGKTHSSGIVHTCLQRKAEKKRVNACEKSNNWYDRKDNDCVYACCLHDRSIGS